MDCNSENILIEYINVINLQLKFFIDKIEFHKNKTEVVNAMWYSLAAGGKRLRPVLAMEFAKMLGVPQNMVFTSAAAIEMIHTFSLIHDDLPSMDNDDFRRGIPSCHKKFGEAVALLAGDALENLAYEIICNDPKCDTPVAFNVLRELSNAVGINGMIGGQAIDINIEGSIVDEMVLREMYSCKTGALITVACRIGCIIGNATDELLAHATIYGEKIGLAFQIVDDILDVIGSQEELGKPIGSDVQQQKTTFVTLFGIEKATKLVEKLTNEALNELKYFPNNEFLTAFTKSLVVRKK